MPNLSTTDLILNHDGSIYHLNLRPTQISDTIITVGDPNRVHLVSRYFDHLEFEMNRREFITHVGQYKGKRITVISTGMGTDNVEIFMQELDALFNIDLKKREPKSRKKKLKIVRIGSSASIQEDIRLGSHIISEYALGLDPLAHFYHLKQSEFERTICNELQEELELPYSPYCVKGSNELIEKFSDLGIRGNTVTCPGFFAPQGRSLRVPIAKPDLIQKLNYYHKDRFWLTNLEMETAGYYAMAKLLGHEIISMNAIIANRVRDRFSKDPNRIIDSLIRKVLDRI